MTHDEAGVAAISTLDSRHVGAFDQWLPVDDWSVVVGEAFVLAGLVVGGLWTPPPHVRESGLPASVMTISPCLVDLVAMHGPSAGQWYADLPQARAAAQVGPAEEDLHVLAAHVSAADRDALASLIDGWVGAECHPVRDNLVAMADPVGQARGFEVVGFESDQLHSWLCYDLYTDVPGVELKDHLTELGLLASADDAQAVAAMANAHRGSERGTPSDVTWFAVWIAEC